MKMLRLFIITLMALPVISFAQHAEGFKFRWKVSGEQKQVYTLSQPNSLLTNKNSKEVVCYITGFKEIKYSLPKGVVFCRMEDALHERFNFWFKVRMGCDDKYSN